MGLIVQKYGGTSVADVDRILNVARNIKKFRDQGNQVVVVVSARSGVTNDLIARARQLNATPDAREMDMLLAVGEQETIALTAMALHSIGVPAVSRTGAQAGILTDHAHTRARILKVDAREVQKALDEGNVVIVAGFQGMDSDRQITTLGRGGSDLTAVALSAELKADICQIFTDVDGVYTADPRIVSDARRLEEISYDEMLELSSLGSKVMQSRSVEFAKKYRVPFEVRSSFEDKPGTIVKEEVASMEDVVVRGVALDRNQAKVVVSDIPDEPGSAARVFRDLAEEGVVVDMIVQNVGRGGRANLSFTVPQDDQLRAEKIVSKALEDAGEGGRVSLHDDVVKLSVVGVGMRSHSGVAATLFEALSEKGINIEMISTSEIKISVILLAKFAEEAVRVAHKAFNLSS